MAATCVDPSVVEAVSAAIGRAVEAGDLEALRSIYASDVRVWHSTDDTEKTVDEALTFFGGLVAVSSKRWYEEVRLTPTATGYVQQHYICAVLTNGGQVRAPICMVVTLEGERVKRLEEYMSDAGAETVTEAIDASNS